METQYPKFRWFVLITCIVLVMAQSMILISPSPLIQSIYISIFGTPQHADLAGNFAGFVSLGLMVTFNLAAVLSSIFGGMLVDRFGLPKIYTISTAIMIFASVIFIFSSNNFSLLIFSRVLGGLGGGVTVATTAKVASEWFPPKEHGMVNGIASAAFAAGIAVGLSIVQSVYLSTGAETVYYLQNITTDVIDSANRIIDPSTVNPLLFADNRLVRTIEGGNWNLSIGIMCLVAVLGLIMCIVWLKGPKPPQTKQAQVDTRRGSGDSLFKMALKQPVFYFGFLLLFCVAWRQNVLNDLTPNHLGDTFIGFGWGAANGGAVLGMFSLAFLAGSLVCGFIYGPLFKNKVPMLSLGANLIFAVSSIVLLMPQFMNPDPSIPGMPPVILTIGVVIAGFVLGLPQPALMSFISMNYPKSVAGGIAGMTSGFGYFGGVVGVTVSSILLSAASAYTASIITCIVISLIGAVIGLFVKRNKALDTLEAKSIETGAD